MWTNPRTPANRILHHNRFTSQGRRGYRADSTAPRRRPRRRASDFRPTLCALESRQLLSTVTFRQGHDDAGQLDRHLRHRKATTSPARPPASPPTPPSASPATRPTTWTCQHHRRPRPPDSRRRRRRRHRLVRAATSFAITVDLTDGQAHDLALYAVDWTDAGRSEQIQITNASTGAVLDTETISSFVGGGVPGLGRQRRRRDHGHEPGRGQTPSSAACSSTRPTRQRPPSHVPSKDTTTQGNWIGDLRHPGLQHRRRHAQLSLLRHRHRLR